MTTRDPDRTDIEIARIQEIINSGPMQRERKHYRADGVNVVPKNAASIVLVRGEPGHEEVIMGQRNQALKFMPGALVFPGGRVDRTDWRIPAADPLPMPVRAKLMAGMRGKTGESSAHGLGIAAIRELHEETGFLAGRKHEEVPRHRDWKSFAEHGLAPSLSPLRLLARAITPPGVPRRFDTWFFIARLDHHFHEPDAGFIHSGELEELRWITPEAAMAENTREITRVILVELMNRLRDDPALNPETPIPCYTTARDVFRRAML